MKIFTLVNTLQNVNSFVYANHINLFAWTKKHRPDISLNFYSPNRMSIDHARNNAAIFAKQHEADYLFFLDDDVMVPPQTLDLLTKADKDVIAGLVIIRGYPFNVMAFDWESEKKDKLIHYNDLPKNEDNSLVELVKCAAVGFSCCLIKMDVLKALEPPYFVTGPHNTEDVYFCIKAQEMLDPTPEIFMHTGVRCGHMLTPETVSWGTREKLKAFYKDMMETSFNRDEEYIKANREALKDAVIINS